MDEQEIEDVKGVKKLNKEKMIQLFSDSLARLVLNESEMFAVCEFLCLKVKPFMAPTMKRSVLLELVSLSSVIDIESNPVPFTHNLDHVQAEPNHNFQSEY